MLGNLIQVSFHLGRILNVDDLPKVRSKKLHYLNAQLGSQQFFAFFDHITADLDRLNDRRIGGRTADAFIFHLFYQRSFCIMGRRFRKMLFARHDLMQQQRRPRRHVRHLPGIFFLYFLFIRQTQITVKCKD